VSIAILMFSSCVILTGAVTPTIKGWSSELLSFKRIYKVNEVAKYRFEMAGPNGSTFLSSDIEATVTALTPQGAWIHYRATKWGPSPPNGGLLPELIAEVRRDGIPLTSVQESNKAVFVFTAMAGGLPERPARVGDQVSIHWEDDEKDGIVEGTGTVLSASKADRTTVVQWKMSTRSRKDVPGYSNVSGIMKIRSVYSLDDFALIRSTGTLGVGAKSTPIHITRID
jgi:hypothetical protein